MKNDVSAIYVDLKGPYSTITGVDLWDEVRDARNYRGDLPVVAHPPCNRWGRLAPVNHKRWGTPIGEDGGCFKHALWAVTNFGGVLEHPAHTIAWKTFGITKPSGLFWEPNNFGGWVGEVWQAAYGHLATKRTWLLYVGDTEPEPFIDDKIKGTHQVGGGIHTGNNKKPRLPQNKTHLTPAPFADYLVRLARQSITKQPQ